MKLLFPLNLLIWLLPITAHAGQDTLFVSIPPQKYLLERLTGDDWEVKTLLGPAANPHNYDPPARQLAELADARIYFTIGLPFESQWRPRLQALSPELQIKHCGAELHDHGHHDHGHHPSRDLLDRDVHEDPHIWTSPIATHDIVECMTSALVTMQPAHRVRYEQRRDALQQDLMTLDTEIRGLLQDVQPRYLLVQHPAWDYFADSYGFEQVSIERNGHEPNARHLVQVIEFARHNKLTQVLVQRQYRQAPARIVADATAAEIIELDPMAEDYLNNLRHVAATIARGAVHD